MKKLAAICLFATASTTPAFAAGDITLTAGMAFPESLTSTADGTVYIGSLGLGTVYRVAPRAGGRACGPPTNRRR